jgi:anti-sigma B factor antagonist
MGNVVRGDARPPLQWRWNMSQTTANKVLDREDFGDVTVLRMKVPTLQGDETTDSLFEQAYSVVDDAGRAKIVLNLDGVGYLASVALGKLVKLMQKTRMGGGKLVLCKVSRNLEEVLRVTHLSDVLLTYADEQEGVRSFRSHP